MVIDEIRVPSIIEYINDYKIRGINNNFKKNYCYDYIYLFEDNFMEKLNINASLKVFMGESKRKEKYLLINKYFKDRIIINNNMILFKDDIRESENLEEKINPIMLLAFVDIEDSEKLKLLLTI